MIKSLLCAGVCTAFITSAVATEKKDIKEFTQELKKHLESLPLASIEDLDHESETYKFFHNNFKKFISDKITLRTPKGEDLDWQDIKVKVEGKSVKLIKLMEDADQTGQLTFYKGLRQALSKYAETDLTKNDLIKFYLKAIKKNYLDEYTSEEELKSIPEHKIDEAITDVEKVLLKQFDRFYTFLEELNKATKNYVMDIDFKKMFDNKKLPTQEKFKKAFNNAVEETMEEQLKEEEDVSDDELFVSKEFYHKKIDKLKEDYNTLKDTHDEEVKKLKQQIEDLKKTAGQQTNQTPQQQTQSQTVKKDRFKRTT